MFYVGYTITSVPYLIKDPLAEALWGFPLRIWENLRFLQFFPLRQFETIRFQNVGLNPPPSEGLVSFLGGGVIRYSIDSGENTVMTAQEPGFGRTIIGLRVI